MNTKLANELEGIEAAIRAACDDMTRMGTLSAETWCNLRNAHRDVKCLVTGGDYIPKPLPAISNLRMWGIYNTTDHVWIVKNDIWGPRQSKYGKYQEAVDAIAELRKTMAAMGVTKNLVILEIGGP